MADMTTRHDYRRTRHGTARRIAGLVFSFAAVTLPVTGCRTPYPVDWVTGRNIPCPMQFYEGVPKPEQETAILHWSIDYVVHSYRPYVDRIDGRYLSFDENRCGRASILPGDHDIVVAFGGCVRGIAGDIRKTAERELAAKLEAGRRYRIDFGITSDITESWDGTVQKFYWYPAIREIEP